LKTQLRIAGQLTLFDHWSRWPISEQDTEPESAENFTHSPPETSSPLVFLSFVQ
jgi:hypothetical protein